MNKMQPKIKINALEPIISFNPIADSLLQTGLIKMTPQLNALLPQYKEMVDTGIASEEITQALKGSRYSFNNELAPYMLVMSLRDDYIVKNGFVLLNERQLETVKEQFDNKSMVDVGAGNGFLSSKLQGVGLDITPVDVQDPTKNSYGFTNSCTNVLNEDAVKHIQNKNYDVVLMSWPPMGEPFAHDVLHNMKVGQQLIYIGEFGGCTADSDFFKLLTEKANKNDLATKAVQKHSLSFPGIKDDWHVYDIIK